MDLLTYQHLSANEHRTFVATTKSAGYLVILNINLFHQDITLHNTSFLIELSLSFARLVLLP